MPDDDQGTAGERTRADKARSRSQSRPVSPKGAARPSSATRRGGNPGQRGSSGGQGSGNAQRRSAQRAGTATAAQGRRPPRGPGGRAYSARRAPKGRRALYTWGAVGLVVVIVAVVVAVSQLGGGGGGTSSEATPAPTSVTQALTTIPRSVFDAIGVTTPSPSVNPPSVLHGQPALTYTSDARTLPGVLYYGAEFCPYCAAERWAFAATLARFGTLSGLDVVRSSPTDIYPNTATLSFVRAKYSSPYIAVRTVEAENVDHQPLQTPTAEEQALLTKYDTSQYVSGLSSSADGSIPFIDFGNKALIVGASYNPAVLAGLDQEQIASALHDPSNPITKYIVATSNYQSAAICSMTKGRPGSVCNSSGVQAAAKQLKLSF